jgi:ribosomal protein L22
MPTVVPPVCFFPNSVEQPKKVRFTARKNNIKYSCFKLNACAMVVRKKHIYDALALIKGVSKKGGEIIRTVLEAARNNGVNKGYAEERMFVKEVVIGKELGQKKIDIRARGKFGMIHASKSQVTVIMEEMTDVDFYKQMVSGKCPSSVGYVFKKMLYQSDANFEQVKALSHLTTS